MSDSTDEARLVRGSVLGIKALIGYQRLVGEDVAVYETEFLKLASEVRRGDRIALVLHCQ
jgi:hypothetical protein